MLAAVASRCSRGVPGFREFSGRGSGQGLSIGRRILDNIRQARDSLGSGKQPTNQGRSLTNALKDLEKVVINPELPPTMLDGNRDQLRRLQGFCLRLGLESSFPPKETLRIQFAVKKPTGMEYARALLRTTGSDCEDGVYADLTSLFERAGVDPAFQFLEGEFEGGRRTFQQAMMRKYVATKQGKQPNAPAATRQTNPSRPGTPTAPPQLTAEEISALNADVQDAAAVESKEAAAQRWQSRMEQMDPLFGALAALPWFVGVDAEKANHVKTVVLDTLEGDGWDIRGPVHKIWAGQRDYQALRVGIDPGSSDAIKAVLRHALEYDKQYGLKTYRPQ